MGLRIAIYGRRGIVFAMKASIFATGPALLLLASCSGGMSSGPVTASQAKADNATFLSGLSAASRQTAMFCQVQFQQKLGGKVYVVSAPSMQGGDIMANATTNAISKSLLVVYDRVANGTVTSAARQCELHSENIVVHPTHAD